MIVLPEALIVEPSATHYTIPVTYETLDLVKQAAIDSTFDCWLVQYNSLLFGSASNRIETLALLLNPYFQPGKVKLPIVSVRRCVYEAIIDFPNLVDDPLTEEEQDVATWLPNGYTKKTTHRKLYRPVSGAELIGKYIDEGCCILHPWLPRAMHNMEINLCLSNCALNYFDEHLSTHFTLADNPIPPEYLQYDISHKLPTCHYNLIVPKTYEFKKGLPLDWT